MSSWLSRLGQQQGMTAEDLFGFLSKKPMRDADYTFSPQNVWDVVAMTRLQRKDFLVQDAVYRAIRRTNLLRRQILTGKERTPISRFCPYCLKTDPLPYYRIEWRFKFWKYCPKHGVEMQTICSNCQQSQNLNRSLVSSEAPLNLAFCRCCQSYLGGIRVPTFTAPEGVIDTISAVQQNMMASIVSGYCRLAPFKKRFSLHAMIRLHQAGLLLPATQTDFEHPYTPEQKEALFKFLNKIQIKTRRKEQLHEKAARRQKARVPLMRGAAGIRDFFAKTKLSR